MIDSGPLFILPECVAINIVLVLASNVPHQIFCQCLPHKSFRLKLVIQSISQERLMGSIFSELLYIDNISAHYILKVNFSGNKII